MKTGLLGGLALAVLLASFGTAAGDPALTALRQSDVYVAASVVQDERAAEKRLLVTTNALRHSQRTTKIAIVPGPVGSPSMAAYAKTLRSALRLEGTLVVAASGAPVAVDGPLDAATVTKRLREAHVARIPNTVERAAKAAEVSAVRTDTSGSGATRGLFALLALGLMGGLWAVASGVRRRQAEEREVIQATRTVVTEGVDELGRRVERQSASIGNDTPTSEGLATAAQEYAAAREELNQARSIGELQRLLPRVERGLEATERAGSPGANEMLGRLRAISRKP